MAAKQQLLHLYVGLPPCLPRLLPAGAIAGWALHPLEKRRLVTAHVDSGPSLRPPPTARLRRDQSFAEPLSSSAGRAILTFNRAVKRGRCARRYCLFGVG